MPGLFGIFELGRNSLLAQQAALQTAGHNIANAATPGYHRQRVETGPTLPELTAFGALGTGVRIDTIRRVENRFLELSAQREIPLSARYSARAAVLSEAELTFGDPAEGGMQTFLEQFFTAWDDLASSPEDSGARDTVARTATSLVQTMRSTRQSLVEKRDALSGEMRSVVDGANRAIHELERLNHGIMASEARGATSLGDLADRRDAVIETLNDLVGAEASIETNGTATLRLGGRVLVQAGISAEIAWDEGTPNVPMLGGRSLGLDELEGRLGGLLQARDEDLAAAIQGLDEFAARLFRDVNAIYQQGTNSSGGSGNAFFVSSASRDEVTNAAGTIALNPILAQDPARISTGRTSAAGDNAIALDIAALRSTRGGPASLLNAVVVDLGGRAREANDLARGQEIVLDAIRAERESASGVSLDEEGANLLRFQRSYQASAQLISIADEMTATLLAI